MVVGLSLYSTAYNPLSQAFEPFIEPWYVSVSQVQETSEARTVMKVTSKNLLEFNLSAGMLQSIQDFKQRLSEKTLKIDEELEREKKLKERQANREAKSFVFSENFD